MAPVTSPLPIPPGARTIPDRDIPDMPSLSDMELVSHVRNLFGRAREVRRPLVAQWIRNYEILNNKTWGTTRANWQPSPEVPEIKPIISSLVGWMTDQRAQLDVTPSMEPFSPFVQFYDHLARDLNTVLDSTWAMEDYDAEIEKMLFDGFTYGTGIVKSSWDNQLHGGLGNAIIKRIDPFTFYPDPDARDMASCNYMIEARTMSAQEIERRWPGAIEKIGMSGSREGVDHAPTATSASSTSRPMANPGAISPATAPKWGLPGGTNADRSALIDDMGVTIFECWYRCPRPTDIPDTETGKTTEVLIDAWRCVVVAGNHVLMDEWADDIYSHGEHPYDRYVIEETGEFWGKAMCELLTPSQISINRLLAAIEHNIWLMGNPVFMEDRRAGLERQRITNRPGQRLTKNSGGEAKWLDPPQMHPQMSSDLVRFYIGEMERISGLSAIVRGATPTGRNAEGVLGQVQEAAFVRIRLALRNLERTLRRVGNKVASIIAEFYDTPRTVSITGDGGTHSWLAISGRHFYTQTPDGRVPMKFMLQIEAGSSVATSRQARIAEIDTLYAMGAVDDQAVLEAHRIPNWQQISQRVQALKAANGTLGQPPGSRARSGRKS